MKINSSAIILSAGRGLRMGGDVPKQYLKLCNEPVLYYAVKAFAESKADELVIVCADGDEEMIRREIISRLDIKKRVIFTIGGKERFDSVSRGLEACDKETKYVFIHDGARPLITPAMIEKLFEEVKKKRAVVSACRMKDTVKLCDEDGRVLDTPDRSRLWQVQTPQVFEYELISTAYRRLLEAGDTRATDDAYAVEHYMQLPVHVCDTGYENIKITTPEDMIMAEAILNKNKQK